MGASKTTKGYRSPVDLGLPQIPQVQDQEQFTQLMLIYNALHGLNAYLDSLRLALEGGDPEQKPSETMRFLRSVWVPAAVDITAGNVLTINTGKAHLGAHRMTIGGQTNSYLTGIALTDAKVDEKVRFGIGPAVLEVAGFKAGMLVYAPLIGEDQAGKMFLEAPPSAAGIDTVVIGHCFMDDFVMITSGFAY